jgi:1A family penicillin-binding protein
MVVRKYNRKTYEKEKTGKLLKAFRLLVVFFLLGLISAISLFFYYGRNLPRPEKFTEKQLFQPTQIYDRTGEVLLYQIYGEEKREWVDIEEIPSHMKEAVIAAEDSHFYSHFGIDIRGLLRAVIVDFILKEPAQGGSTITQQLIRSSFLTNIKTIERKVKEFILTFDLERKFSKDEILEFYLNQIPLGENCYGVQTASKTYFNKPISEISIPEAATLTSLIKGPSYLSPYGNHIDELLGRKDYVLKRMVQEGYIKKEDLEELQSQEINFVPGEEISIVKAPHFTLEIKDYLIRTYGESYLNRNGLKVYTTLDWDIQKEAERIVEEKTKINENYDAHNASLVVIDPWTGEILSMIGSKGYFKESYPKDCKTSEDGCLFSPRFNVATQGERQPGSAFKPFTYLTAFQKGFNPETVVWDVETNFGTENQEYIPKNYTGTFQGPINLRNALAQSINIPAIKTLYLSGGQEVMKNAEKMGITTLDKPFSYYGLPLVLGGGEVKLIEMVFGYGVFATEGYTTQPVNILKIEDLNGNIIYENKKQIRKTFNPEPFYLLNDVLSDNNARAPLFGYNSQLYFEDYNVAAKTGTTQEYNDAWTIGYTPDIVVGVWVGNNNNDPTNRKPGISLSGPIFHEVTKKTLEKYSSGRDFTEPLEYPEVHNSVDWENPHSLLYYIKKEDPLGSPPEEPSQDPQFLKWEKGIQEWLENTTF